MTKKTELNYEDKLELGTEKKVEENKTTNYVDPNEELFDNLIKEKIGSGSIKISEEDLFDEEENKEEEKIEENNSEEIKEKEEEKKQEEKVEVSSELEQLRKEKEELMALKAELERTKEMLLKKEEVKEEPKQEVSKKTLKKEEKAKKLESGLMKILEGEVDAIEELKEALLADEESSTDIETLVSKKAEEIANKRIQEYEQQKQFIEFNNSFVAKHKELNNDAFMHIFNDQLGRLAGSAEGSGLTLDGLYDKALKNSKDFAAKLGFNQSPQNSEEDDSEMKAKLEKAKAASVTDTSAVSVSSTKKKESDKLVTDKFLFKSFFENFNS